jgi:plasmid stabilization system protein ParE
VKTYGVVFAPEAEDYLIELYEYVAMHGSKTIAARFAEAIVEYCEGLATFAHRATRRDDIRPGLLHGLLRGAQDGRSEARRGDDPASACPPPRPPARRPGLCLRIERLHQLALRRRMKPTPARPRPKSANVEGSGTAATGEIDVMS